MTQLVLVPTVEQELRDRLNLFANLPGDRSPKRTNPSLLRQLGIYSGASGIWFHKKRTGRLTEGDVGVTVSVLHTGVPHPDALASDGVLYSYPNTGRSLTRDASEIEATKEAGRLRLPVFVITYPSPNSTSRNVFLGWVEGWDDVNKVFLITFDTNRPQELLHKVNADDEPFLLVQPSSKKVKGKANLRPSQQRFKFRVMLRYGSSCLLCGVNIVELLNAAHIRPKRYHGTDDPRNGLLLCSLHDQAFDAKMFGIEPHTLMIKYRKDGPDKSALKITIDNLQSLEKKPHSEALRWFWERWNSLD